MNNLFFRKQPKKQVDRYYSLLQKVGAFSNLFSESRIPYLYYRAAENIFCKAFEADNHSRSDTSADAAKYGIGIGIKTYINNSGETYQKIAEFNKNRTHYSMYRNDPKKIVTIVSSLRNKRIDFAKSVHDLNDMIYHCIAREEEKFLVFEEPMNYIKTENINVTQIKPNNIYFTDGIEDYNFNLSKSTLFKRFKTINPFSFGVNILDDPFDFLEQITGFAKTVRTYPKIYLPLYSEKEGQRYIPEKSGLNQWNASGRPRDEKEVYIRIPLWIHRVYPDFFPPKDQPFNLKLPNGKILSAKICQQGGKALMSNPNKALGEWLIDQVLKIKTGNIVTYDLLKTIGTDTVEVRKTGENDFEIDFKDLDTYENFLKIQK